MAWVRLIEDYENHKAGEVVDLPAVVARGLIHNKKAVGGRVFEKAIVSYKTPEKVDTVKTVHPKPLNGTIPKIKKWLDANNVEYSSTARKPELIKILKEA